LTHFPISDSRSCMGRPPLNVTPVLVRLPNDVPERIDAIVGKHKRAEFIRQAIERELRRHEAAKAKKADDT
jgi:metal-responsive CopG/Arc/MetJ family transcriptional regulator